MDRAAAAAKMETVDMDTGVISDKTPQEDTAPADDFVREMDEAEKEAA
jgi:hypothetical protein